MLVPVNATSLSTGKLCTDKWCHFVLSRSWSFDAKVALVSFQVVLQLSVLIILPCINLYRLAELVRCLCHAKQLLVANSTYFDARLFQVRLELGSARTECIDLDLVTDPLFICWLLGLHVFLISYFEIGWSHFLHLVSPVCSALINLFSCYWMLNQILSSLRNVIRDGVSHSQVRLVGISFQIIHFLDWVFLLIWRFLRLKRIRLLHRLSI